MDRGLLINDRDSRIYFVREGEKRTPDMYKQYWDMGQERKKLKFAKLVVEAREHSWQAHTRPVEISVRGFVGKSTITLELDLVSRERSLKGAV